MKPIRRPSIRTSMLALFLSALLIVYGWDLWTQHTKQIVLQLFIANDEQNRMPEKTVEQDLSKFFSLEQNQKVAVDDSLYITFGVQDRYIEASLSKLYAYMAAKELDVLIAPRAVAEHYVAALPFLDIPTLLANRADLLEIVHDSLVKSEGKEKAYLLDLSTSRYAHSDADTLVIPASAPHKEAIIQFLSYLYSMQD
ncbi:MAG: hypothetical protein AB7C91_00860 [Sphaerochaeta sp.]|uniref:hypothetical protein n=1 Tax=Sphaerochaeta sp. TaxID=1972642 RepID=UPI003D0A652A